MAKTWRIKLLVLGTSLILSLLGAELAFRLYLDWRRGQDLAQLEDNKSLTRVDTIYLGKIIRLSDKPDLIYELKPKLSGKYYGRRLTTNAAGLRGQRITAREKPPGVLRIVGIGDSYMFGQRVADGETYMDLLPRLLEPSIAPKRAEAINLAVPGYNTTMERASLEHKGMAYSPDMIVVGVVGNDWDLPDFMLEGPMVRPLGSVILGKLHQIFRGPPTLKPTPRSERAAHRFLHAKEAVPPRYRHMVGFSSFFRALGRIQRFAARAGAKVVLFSDCLPRSSSQVDCDFHYQPGEKRTLWQHLDRWGFTRCEWSLDPAQRFAQDGHPNAAGHRELARQLGRCIAPLLKRRGAAHLAAGRR